MTYRTPRRTRSQWLELIQQYRESGLLAEEFCRNNGLVLGTFRKHLYERPNSPDDAPLNKHNGFHAVTVSTPASATMQHPICIRLGDHVQIGCSSEVAPETITHLALALHHGS